MRISKDEAEQVVEKLLNAIASRKSGRGAIDISTPRLELQYILIDYAKESEK